MSRRDREAAIVAELGRPETPEETAARKAQNSRNHRDRQTTRNLVFALLASLGVVVLLVLIVPRGEMGARPDVDYAAVAVQAQSGIETPLVVPRLGDGWSSNDAELRSGAADGVTSWYIGFLTPSSQFLGMSQGLEANESWLTTELNGSRPTGTVVIEGVEWNEYDYREADDRGNLEYALSTTTGDDYYVVYGTADESEAATLAAAVSAEFGATP